MPIVVLVFAVAIIGFTVVFIRSRTGGQSPAFKGFDHASGKTPWPPALTIGLGLGLAFLAGVILSEEPELFPGFLGILVVVGLALFTRAWAREFIFLMTLEDSEFPGRFDKLIWGMVLITLPPIGVWTFKSYREVRWPEPVGKAETAQDL
jgi:hypothetical protein